MGRVLAFSPAGTDGAWPHEAVRSVIERVQSDDIDGAFTSQAKQPRRPRQRNPRGRVPGTGAGGEVPWPRGGMPVLVAANGALLYDIADFYDRWARLHGAETELGSDDY